jgi:putative endonuclease
MYYVYITTNKSRSVLYTGVTNNLQRRIFEHKNKLISGFTKRYNVDLLVYYEEYSNPQEAIAREKSIKNLVRRKKEILVSSINPDWLDLSEKL